VRPVRPRRPVVPRHGTGRKPGLAKEPGFFRFKIDKTPNYQLYLAQVNRLKDKYCDLLLLGRCQDTEGFLHGNPRVQARCFVNTDRLAVVATQSPEPTATTRIRVPGDSFQASDSVGDVRLNTTPGDGQTPRLGRHGLAVLVDQKESITCLRDTPP
jgi:hypothetical protein